MTTTIGDTMDNSACYLDSLSSTSCDSSTSSLSFVTQPKLTPNNQPITRKKDNSQPRIKTKLPSSKYKGVVPQTNGRWGAQIYNGHKRVWLGTFDHQEQAARAHDLAAIRFRGFHAAVNFSAHNYFSKPVHVDFLSSHSMSQVVSMLRRHTYHDELVRFARARLAAANRMKKRLVQGQALASEPEAAPKERLFEKILTASDIGKGTLHRLVIPKCHAERDLPALKADKGMMLTFEEAGGERVWKFKYCYWKGSKNFVLTKGWSHFVKEKGLNPGDVVAFYRSSGPEKWLYIDSGSSSSSSNSSLSSSRLSQVTGAARAAQPGDDGGARSGDVISKSSDGVDMLRLFGVDIKVRNPIEFLS